PQVLVVDLGYRGAQPTVELGLDRGQLLALALQAAGVGEVQIDHQHRDKAAVRHRRPPRTELSNRGHGTGLHQLAFDLPGGVRLDHVAVLDVGEVPEHDAAVIPRGDLADVLVEPPQALDLSVVDDRTVADQTDLRAAGDRAVRDVAAGDRADARGAEDL